MEVYSVISLISGALSLLYLAVVAFLVVGWKRLPVLSNKTKLGQTRVSIIMAARNEASGIYRTITCLLEQKYPEQLREIIIVDDHSTDNTAQIIRNFENRGVILIKLHEAEKINSYKKKAIEKAIEKAQGDLIVTTDADCVMGEDWLSAIVANYEETGNKMISSPVQFFEERGVFERCQSLEFLYLIGLGAATIGNRRPSTCNGANLAYERNVFYDVQGFKGIDELASGDDELLLHKVAARYPDKIGFLKDLNATVYTHAKPDLGAFISQRKRWASKSTKYENKSIVWLGVCMWLFNLSILINLITGVFDIHYLSLGLVQLGLKIGAEFLFLAGLTSFFRRRELLPLLPLVSSMHVFYIVYIGLAGNSGKYQWKERKVN